jgi:hypothetical protein
VWPLFPPSRHSGTSRHLFDFWGEKMKRFLCISVVSFCASALVAALVVAKPGAKQRHQLSSPDTYVDVVGDVDGTNPAPQKVIQDTVWIADWTFDTGACDGSLPVGWHKGDNYIRDGHGQYEPGLSNPVEWTVDNAHDLTGGITGNAARAGYINDVCAVDQAGGYYNGMYQGLRIEYEGGGGTPAIRFDYLLDSEGGYDFMQVETDSACSSHDRYDPLTQVFSGQGTSGRLRSLVYDEDGLNTAGVANVPLTDYGPGTHCVFITFHADGSWSPQDGLWPTTIGAGLVVDNIELDDATGTNAKTEDFELGNTIGTCVNMDDTKPFGPVGEGGSWGRTYEHITDNDLCTENGTCAILWTDHTNPSIANDASMAFAPNSYVVKNWLDDVVFSPWASLATTPNAQETVFQMRRFPGNAFGQSRMVQNWAIRGGFDADDGMGGTIPCTTAWGHNMSWNSLSLFRWRTWQWDASAHFDPSSEKVQIRLRTSDWQWIVGISPPADFKPGPGPFNDRIRIGRIVLTGPVLNEGIDARFQAQDAFPTEINPLVSPGTGEHFRPSTDRFGTAAFSYSHDILGRSNPHIVPGDSITCYVDDVRGAGGVTSVGIYAAIVSGPHAGMAPPPYTVEANGFFYVEGDSSRYCANASCSRTRVIESIFFVDLDDEYFVGGDELHYFWAATDAQGGFSSLPVGLTSVPNSIVEAQEATQGMFQVNFLPTNNWDPDYLAAVAANNKVDPNSDPSYLDQSTQRNCILYVNHVNYRRRSGDVNRTSFMYALDALGYRGHYDVYDHSGMGNTNNQLGGRATVQQAQGYSLLIYDTGNQRGGTWLMPTGDPVNLDSENVDQDGWFQSWLAQASTSEAGQATLWLIGSNLLDEHPTLALYSTEMQSSRASSNQGLNANPDVEGQGSFQFYDGTIVDFSAGAKGEFALAGGCPTLEDYDGLAAIGTAVDVYRYADPYSATVGDAAVVMNANAAASYNTIMQSFAFFDIRDQGPPNGTPGDNSALDYLSSMLGGVLPSDCLQDPGTDTGGEPTQIEAPARTALYQNAPNPFNPTTTIRFDLARDGHVELRIYNVSGRQVRTLVNGPMERKRHKLVWDGMDDAGMPVSSGIYFYRLETADFRDTHKMVVLR